MLMDYSEFKDYVAKNIKRYLPKEFANFMVEIVPIDKGNSIVFDSLMIREDEDSEVVTHVYLNQKYISYFQGNSLDTVMKLISGEVQHNHKRDLKKCTKDILEFVRNYDLAKSKIHMKAIGVSMNQELLRTVPHRIEGDIAVIYKLVIEDEIHEGYIYKTTILNDTLVDWKVSEDEIFKQAQVNMRRQSYRFLKDLLEISIELRGLTPENDVSGCTYDNEANIFITKKESTGNCYVLTNEEKNFGAGLIFDLRIRKLISERFDAPGCYIIPSSLHEVILMPDNGWIDLDYLSESLRSTNLTTIKPEDRLSDMVHYLDFSTGRIEIARK